MSEDIVAAREGDVYTITFNRPDRGNAMSDDMIGRLGDLVLGVEDSVRVIVLRGAGDDFCTGRAGAPPPGPPPDALQALYARDVVFRAYGAIRDSRAPVIALVKGRALGFGCAVAAAADITIAGTQAEFQIPEFAHGIMPTMVMSALIDRVPLKALMYRVYTTKSLSAAQALAIGMTSDVVPEAELDQTLQDVLASLLQAPRPALLAVKEYAQRAQAIDMRKAVDYARYLHATVNTAGEMKR